MKAPRIVFLTRTSQPPLPRGPIHVFAATAELDEIVPRFGLTTLPNAARMAHLKYQTALRAVHRLDFMPTPQGNGWAVLLTSAQLRAFVRWSSEVRDLKARLRELSA